MVEGTGGGHEQPRAGDRSTCLSALPTNPETEVPKARTVLYLLNPEHRSGKSKARFLSGHGYTAETWQELAETLRAHARQNQVARQEPTPLGVRFVVEGPELSSVHFLPDATPRSWSSHAKVVPVEPPCTRRISPNADAVFSRAQFRCHSLNTAIHVMGTAPACTMR